MPPENNIIDKKANALVKLGNWFRENPIGFAVMFMLVCTWVVNNIYKGTILDLKSERDLYKNIILEKVKASEPVLSKVEKTLDTLAPKAQETESTLSNIINNNHDAKN